MPGTAPESAACRPGAFLEEPSLVLAVCVLRDAVCKADREPQCSSPPIIPLVRSAQEPEVVVMLTSQLLQWV